jgi:UrcA family protein
MRTIIVATAAAAASLVATSAGAAPVRETVVNEVVSFADLNLTLKADQARLERRVRATIAALCPGDDRASPAPPLPDPLCFEAGLKANQPQIDRAIAQAMARSTLAQATQASAR